MQIRTETARSYRSTEVDLLEVACNVQTGVMIAERTNADRSAHGIDHVLSLAEPVSNFNTTTMGRSTFLHVDPLPTTERVVDDPRLQCKLEALCESLRARY